MLKLIKTTFALLVSLKSVTAFANECQKWLLPVVKGHPIKEALAFTAGSEVVSSLGQGRYAQVYRVEWKDKQKSEQVFKVYASPSEAALDLNRFAVLRALLRPTPGAELPFRVPDTKRFDQNTLEIENIKGASIKYLLNSDEVPENEKRLIQSQFERSMESLRGLLEQHYRTPYVNKSGIVYLDQADPDPAKRFILHTGNIVVTRDFQFWIIDPY